MKGGYYCSDCGQVQSLPAGAVRCRVCGAIGLRGFIRPPRRVSCDQPDCRWTGWDDGVNPDRVTHLRGAHGIPQSCEFCRGSGKRRSTAKSAENGKVPCRWCDGRGAR